MAEAERADAVALGPGLGRSAEAHALVARCSSGSSFRSSSTPMRSSASSRVARSHPTVLTPHAGELARLLDRDSAWVDAHRLEAARECAERYGAVVLLKGAGTIVQAARRRPVVCDTGPPSLATAGTGDVLTGVVAAFLAKGLDPVTAACAAATAHGLAAAVAPHQAGLVASDLLAELRRAAPG